MTLQRRQTIEPPAVGEITHVCGITGVEQFAESVRQWSVWIEQNHAAVTDEYRQTYGLVGGDLPCLLDRLTRRHEACPLLAGRDARDGRLLERVLGYGRAGNVWSTYCVAQESETAVFSTIERAGVVLLIAEYMLQAAEPGPRRGSTMAAGLSVEFHATTYLSGWQRRVAPLLCPRLRSSVLGAVAQGLTG